MCKIYDPQTNRPKFTPRPRNEWVPIYPVYKTKQRFRAGETWHYLFVCKHCGTEAIWSLGESGPRVCKCQRRKKSKESLVNIKCLNCGSWFSMTKTRISQRCRHYCSEKCQGEYTANLKPTAEWLALGNKPRDKKLRDIPGGGIYDRPYKPSMIDNFLEI